MAKITLTVKKTTYDPGRVGGQQGYAWSASYIREGTNVAVNTVTFTNGSQHDAIDSAMASILRHTAVMDRVDDVVIEGSSLPKSLQSFLTDKYGSESPINSIDFK